MQHGEGLRRNLGAAVSTSRDGNRKLTLIALTRFDRYLARLIIVPLVASLVIAAMLLLLERMLRLFDFVMNEGGPVSVVWRMLANLLPDDDPSATQE